jgi:hypothetical protein
MSMMRVRRETHQALQELSEEAGESMQEVLARAVEAYRRQLILAKTNEAYAQLRDRPDEWEELTEERREWEATLADGLER